MSNEQTTDLLNTLGIGSANNSVSGKNSLDSFNPATGDVIGRVSLCSDNDYDAIITRSVHAFQEWRNVPAPKRGELVRLIAERLRANKDALGSLVSWERVYRKEWAKCRR